jgi:hypothetical protein
MNYGRQGQGFFQPLAAFRLHLPVKKDRRRETFPGLARLFMGQWGLSMPRKTERDRELFADYEAGRSLEQLGAAYGLTIVRVKAIITGENHRRAVSPEPFYRALRA